MSGPSRKVERARNHADVLEFVARFLDRKGSGLAQIEKSDAGIFVALLPLTRPEDREADA